MLRRSLARCVIVLIACSDCFRFNDIRQVSVGDRSINVPSRRRCLPRGRENVGQMGEKAMEVFATPRDVRKSALQMSAQLCSLQSPSSLRKPKRVVR